MIAFLLGVLKIIGILLLVVLILLLVIVGIVLFVPIRYSGRGQITEDKKEASAKVTWLLKAVQCMVDYTFPEKPEICVKILGVDILRFLEKRKQKAVEKKASGENKTPRKKPEKRPKKQAPGINMSLLEPEVAPQETSHTESEVTETAQEVQAEVKKPADKRPEAQETATSEESTKEKVPLKEKIQTIIDKVRNIIYNIKYYIDILQEEDTKQLLKNAWEAILKILKSIRPREFRVEGVFGFDSPDTTGKVYGFYAVVMPVVGEYIVLEPDFEKQVIKGEVALKGQITIFVIVVNVLRILFDQRVQPLIRKLKHGGNEDGRK